MRLPEGWENLPLDNAAKIIDCKHRTPIYVEEGVPLVSPGTIKWGAIDLESPTKKVSFDEYQSLMDHCTVEIGDLVLSRNQSIGVASYVDKELPFVLGQDTVLVKPIKTVPKFLFYSLQSTHIQKKIYELSGGSTFSRINLGDIRKLKVDCPPLPEQQKIAQILSNWDKAIEKLEALIAAKQKRKKALMQQLLTGKMRFAGFDSEWKYFHLKDVTQILVSPVDKKTVDGEKPVLLCNYTDVYYNIRITKTLQFISATATEREVSKFKLKKGDVIITKDSETPGDIAIPAFVSEDLGEVICGYHLAILRPKKDKVDGEFLNYLLSMQKTRYYFFTLATGATRFGLSVGSIENAHFHLPPIEEQQKIATVLSAADHEIETQQKHLAALKQQKQGLMQQLLTGKKRVKVEEASSLPQLQKYRGRLPTDFKFDRLEANEN